MAALNLQRIANYEIHENVHVDTSDHEDHTFCGIMFPIRAKTDLPISQLVIRSVSVRGHLGPMTVWVTKEEVGWHGENYNVGSLHRIRHNPDYWTKIYDKFHKPSLRKYQVLDFSKNPIVLRPGETKVVYIHSAAHNDLAIVYDNAYSRTSTRYTDAFLSILSGAAHLSPEPFLNQSIWGWGGAWRDSREFVGSLDFGAVYQLWNPELHGRFGNNFHEVTTTILACQRRSESPFAMLPDECIHYILNMCRWDWFHDKPENLAYRRLCMERKRQRQVQTSRLEESRSEARQVSASSSEESTSTEERSERSLSNTDADNRGWKRIFVRGTIRGILSRTSPGGNS